LFCVFFVLALRAQGQVIDPIRRTDWSTVGVTGGIPNRTTVCANIPAYNGSASQINSAIASCPTGQVVQLGAGTFNLSSSICFAKSNVTLRGQGIATVVNFSSSGGCAGWQGGPPEPPFIQIQSSNFDGSGYGPAPGILGIPAANKRNWTGTNGNSGVYTQGATVLNLSSAPTGLNVGDTLTLWQSDLPTNQVPNSGWFTSSDTSNDPTGVAWQGAGEVKSAGTTQRARVVAINGAQVTIAAPGVYLPQGTWATARTPMAGWQSGTLTGIGLENMRITRSTASDMFIGLLAVADSWLTGLAIAPNPNINGNYVIGTVDSRNLTIRNNWIDPGGGANQGGSTFATYGISLVETSQSLVENNITNGLYAPIVMNGASSGNVVAYNYEHFLGAGEGYSFHEEG